MNIYDYCTTHLTVVKEKYPEVLAVCPWCGDTRGKFSFNTDKAVGRCWRASCDQRVTLTALIAKLEFLPFHLAAKKASTFKREGSTNYIVTEKYYDAIGSMPEGSIPLSTLEASFPALPKDEQDIVQYGVLYLTEKRHVDFTHFANLGAAIGVSGKWKGRIILPAVEDGQVVCCTGRLIEVELTKGIWVRYPDTIGEKYKHPDDQDGYTEKRHVVYGVDDVRDSPCCVVVEDSFSCEALKLHGYTAVSFWGTSATAEQLAKLNAKWSAKPRNSVVLLDSDAAKAADKMARELSTFSNVSIASITGQDPDEDIEGATQAIKNAKPHTALSEIESILLWKN